MVAAAVVVLVAVVLVVGVVAGVVVPSTTLPEPPFRSVSQHEHYNTRR